MNRLEILEKLIKIQIEIEYLASIEDDTEEIFEAKKEYNELYRELNDYSMSYEYNDPSEVIEFIQQKYNLPKDFATSKNRNREHYVTPRQRTIILCLYLFRERSEVVESKISLEKIAGFFDKNHATILHARKTVLNLCYTDKMYKAEFEAMQKTVLGGVKINLS